MRYSPPAGTRGKVIVQYSLSSTVHSVHGTTDSPVLSSATRAFTVVFACGTAENCSGSSCDRCTR